MNCTEIETLKEEVSNISRKIVKSEKGIVRIDAKIEFILQGIDEIKAEVKGKR